MTALAEFLIDDCPTELYPGIDCGHQLKVTGSMITRAFNFGRTYTTAADASEVVIDDGRALANTPPGMEDLIKGLPSWSATAP